MRRTILTLLAAFAIGFASKAVVVETERMLSVRLVDRCIEQLPPANRQNKESCYGAGKNYKPYRLIDAINGQPHLWKNTRGRCVGTEGGRADKYFGYGWWNRFAI